MIEITYEMAEADPFLAAKLRVYFTAQFQGAIMRAMITGEDPDGVLKETAHDIDDQRDT